MAESDQFTAIWKEAFDAYTDFTKRKLQNRDELRGLQTTDDLLTLIESHQDGFGSWRHQHAKTWNFLSNCMKPVTLLGGLTSNALSLTPFAPASTVLGAAFFLIQSCDKVTDAYNSIEELFGNLEDFTNRLAEYTKGKIGKQLQKNVAAILTCLLQIIGRAEKTIKHGRIKEYFSATFFGKDEKVQALVDRLNKLMDTEERLVISIVYSTTQRIDAVTQKLDTRTEAMAIMNERTERKVGDIGSKLDESKMLQIKKDEDKLLKEVLASAALGKTEELFRRNKIELLEKSGEWLQTEPLFKDWIDESFALLFVLGGPGTGKSFLSTQTISHLMDLYRQDADHPLQVSIGYFYIKDDEQQLQDLNAMLKSIALRFTSVDNTYRKHAANVCKSVQNIASAQDTWKRLFIDFFASDQYTDHSAFIIIDGLDEAPQAAVREFLKFLEDDLTKPSTSSAPPRLRFAVFGRPEIMDYIQYSHSMRYIDIGLKNQHDIEKYVNENLPKVAVLKEMLRTCSGSRARRLGRYIRTTILERANGLFFWVKLVMEQIYRKARESEIREALDEAPRELDNMIRHVFERLNSNEDVSKRDLNMMLSWVALAKRPLLMGELDVVLSLPTGEHYMGLNEHLKGRFASLFKLPQEDSSDIKDEGSADSTDGDDITPTAEVLGDLDISSEEDDDSKDRDRDEENGTSKSGNDNLKDSYHLDEKTMKVYRTTKVEFSHLRIKEFLLQDGKLETQKSSNDIRIGFNVDEAELNITKMCLKVLCDSTTRDEEFSLFEYSWQHFMEHLEAVNNSKLTIDGQVTGYLLRLFREESIIRNLLDRILDEWGQNEFIQTWLIDSQLSQVIIAYLSKASNSDQPFNPEQHAWLRKDSFSARDLFHSLVSIASEIWLTDPNFGDEDNIWAWEIKADSMIWLLYFYSQLANPQIEQDTSQAPSPSDEGLKESLQQLDPLSPLSDIPANKLIKLATLGKVEKTAYWHANLAYALCSAEYYDEAEKSLDQAIEIDETLWWPKYLMARCFAARDHYHEAVQWASKTSAAIPEDHKKSTYATRLRDQTAEWYLRSGNLEQAIQFTYENYKSRPKDVNAIDLYITALHRGGHTEQVFPLLKTLNSTEGIDGEKSLLTILLLDGWHFQELLPRAISSTECGPELKFACDALPSDGKSGEWWQALQAANLRYRYFGQTEAPIATWESLCEQSEDLYLRTTTSEKLAQIYFDLAVSAKSEGEDPEPWVLKLKDLSKIEEKPKSDSYVYRSSWSALILGHWLREFEQVEEKIWRDCFRSKALEALKMLSDDDATNDQQGYYNLAQILFLAGDRENAIASYAVVLKPLETLATEQADSPQATDRKKTKIKNYIIGYSCDGSCKTEPTDYKELHACETCIDTLFCEECIKLVRADDLPFRKCNSQHAHSQVYPLPKDQQDVVGHLVEGHIEVHKEWVESLKRQWKSV